MLILYIQVCLIDPNNDTSWKELMKSNKHIQTDGVHMKDQLNPNSSTPGEYYVKKIRLYVFFSYLKNDSKVLMSFYQLN